MAANPWALDWESIRQRRSSYCPSERRSSTKMNAMNAAALAKPNPTAAYDAMTRKISSHFLHESDYPKVRKRSCAIDSPSDLIIDEEKDTLLSVSHETDQKPSLEPILEKQEKPESSKKSRKKSLRMRYTSMEPTTRYLYETKRLFDRALEIFNRLQCHEIDGVWKTHGPFFECKGALRVSQRMCTRCRDVEKLITRTDLYYVDLTEKIRERTVLCHGCLGIILNRYIGSDEHQITEVLKHYRKAQRHGIVVIGR